MTRPALAVFLPLRNDPEPLEAVVDGCSRGGADSERRAVVVGGGVSFTGSLGAAFVEGLACVFEEEPPALGGV